jgi:hypothetical protein
MKAIYKKTLLILTFMGGIFTANSRNLNSMPQAQRDSVLISLSKEAVLRYGPGYYREYKEPIIERGQIPPKGTINPTGKNAGRIYYRVTFLYDTTIERLGNNYAAIVGVWGNSGKPSGIRFGTGHGLITFISESEWDSNAVVEQTPYQQSRVRPIYESWDWDREDKAKPKNIDELKRWGYEYKDGEWVKTKKDVPPNIDILKRMGYEEKDGRWVKAKKEVPSRIK